MSATTAQPPVPVPADNGQPDHPTRYVEAWSRLASALGNALGAATWAMRGASAAYWPERVEEDLTWFREEVEDAKARMEAIDPPGLEDHTGDGSHLIKWLDRISHEVGGILPALHYAINKDSWVPGLRPYPEIDPSGKPCPSMREQVEGNEQDLVDICGAFDDLADAFGRAWGRELARVRDYSGRTWGTADADLDIVWQRMWYAAQKEAHASTTIFDMAPAPHKTGAPYPDRDALIARLQKKAGFMDYATLEVFPTQPDPLDELLEMVEKPAAPAR